MKRYVPLDTGIIGLLCSSPMIQEVADCRAWIYRMIAIKTSVVLPDVTVYEARREMIRAGATVKLTRLGDLLKVFGRAPVTPDAWQKADEFWALVRSAGRPTADPHALDGDAILAGVAATIGARGDVVTIATSNVGHLATFPGIDARRWEAIS